MHALLDANIAVALLITLPYTEAAERAVIRAKRISAPDLIISEAANTFWKLAQADMALTFHGQKALARLANFFDHMLPSADVIDEAYMMALEHGHPVQDCIHAAAARHLGAVLITADSRLHELATKSKINSECVTGPL